MPNLIRVAGVEHATGKTGPAGGIEFEVPGEFYFDGNWRKFEIPADECTRQIEKPGRQLSYCIYVVPEVAQEYGLVSICNASMRRNWNRPHPRTRQRKKWL